MQPASPQSAALSQSAQSSLPLAAAVPQNATHLPPLPQPSVAGQSPFWAHEPQLPLALLQPTLPVGHCDGEVQPTQRPLAQ